MTPSHAHAPAEWIITSTPSDERRSLGWALETVQDKVQDMAHEQYGVETF